MPRDTQPIFVYRAVAELRFNRHRFDVLDKKGTLTEELAGESFPKVAITEGGVNIAADDLSKKIFFSTANIGVQMEAGKNLTSFKSLLDELFTNEALMNEFSDTPLLRIGTKISAFYFKRGLGSYETLKRRINQQLLVDSNELDSALNGHITDSAYVYDFASRTSKGHLQMAPITKAEAISRFFEDSPIYHSSISNNHGVLLDIDIYDDHITNLKVSEALGKTLSLWAEVSSTYQNILEVLTNETR